MPRLKKTVLKGAYKELHQRLARLLHAEDPAGFGYGVPIDEYAGEAAHLLARLREAQKAGDVGRMVTEFYPSAGPDLILKVRVLWEEFPEVFPLNVPHGPA